MREEKPVIGFAMTGSFCTMSKAMNALENLCSGPYQVVPIMSEMLSGTDTRFGKAEDFIKRAEEYTGKKVIRTIKDAEPIGPKKLLDALIVAPCTGNTLSKIANGITDSCVSMAVKAHLRNRRPVILSIATNDGLGAGAKNIGLLLNTANIYFVPFGQDDPQGKQTSLISHIDMIEDTLLAALEGRQYQPVINEYR